MRTTMDIAVEAEYHAGVIEVSRDNVPIYRSPLKLPSQMTFQGGADGHFQILDHKGVGFQSFQGRPGCTLGIEQWSDHIAFEVEPYERDGATQVCFTYTIADTRASTYDLPKFVRDVILHSTFTREFDKQDKIIAAQNGNLAVRGPNRMGQLELRSDTGNSSLLFDPHTCLIEPGLGWNETARVTQGTLESGCVMVDEINNVQGRAKRQRYAIHPLWNNTNPNSSYTAELIK